MAKFRALTEVVILVHDLDQSLKFYRDILGLIVMSPPDNRGAVFLQISQQPDAIPQQLVLIPLPQEADPFPVERGQRPLHHFGIEIDHDEFNRESQRLQGLGFALRFGDHPFLSLKGMYLNDPDGNEIEIIAANI